MTNDKSPHIIILKWKKKHIAVTALYIFIYIYRKTGNKSDCMKENVQVLENPRSSEDDFIHSLNYLPMLNVSFFKPSSGCMNF